MTKMWVKLSLIWSSAIGIILWFVPALSSGKSFSEISYFEILPLTIPVLFSLLAVWSEKKKSKLGLWVATICLAAFWLVAGLSIGLLYTPAVLFALIALARMNKSGFKQVK